MCMLSVQCRLVLSVQCRLANFQVLLLPPAPALTTLTLTSRDRRPSTMKLRSFTCQPMAQGSPSFGVGGPSTPQTCSIVAFWRKPSSLL